MITFIFILPVMRKQLTLSRLRSAGQVVYNRKSIQLANKVKKLFTLSQNKEAFQSISPKLRFQYFYIWYAYFRMLPPYSFVDILNNLNLNNIDRSVTEKHVKVKDLFKEVYLVSQFLRLSPELLQQHRRQQ